MAYIFIYGILQFEEILQAMHINYKLIDEVRFEWF